MKFGFGIAPIMPLPVPESPSASLGPVLCELNKATDSDGPVLKLGNRSRTASFLDSCRVSTPKQPPKPVALCEILMRWKRFPVKNYSVLSRFDGPGCGSASDRVSELNTSGRTGEGRGVNVGETRSDAEPQPGPSKRLRTSSSNLENHRDYAYWGYHVKNAPLDSTSWVVEKII
ncbi:hypothetical protein EVAR_87909_1 [Eumeta japonica]|uniref:Uncharacterized protein n=1 Tax=Eumeta variegata TaxID=151549 RepID=A0A4C1WTK7_EUMVA|nr:hypothetical protein EVAR_87909_1 [Eumeta japonica]